MGRGISGLYKNTIGLKSNIDIPTFELNLPMKQIDFYIGPNGKIIPAKLKKWIGKNKRKSLLKKAKNKLLRNAIDQLYRHSSFIGDGGTASIIKFEKRTGIPMGKNGNTHIQKGIEIAKYIKNKILTIKNLTNGDKKLAYKLYKKLIKAIKE